jgi:hypothetical protein
MRWVLVRFTAQRRPPVKFTALVQQLPDSWIDVFMFAFLSKPAIRLFVFIPFQNLRSASPLIPPFLLLTEADLSSSANDASRSHLDDVADYKLQVQSWSWLGPRQSPVRVPVRSKLRIADSWYLPTEKVTCRRKLVD